MYIERLRALPAGVGGLPVSKDNRGTGLVQRRPGRACLSFDKRLHSRSRQQRGRKGFPLCVIVPYTNRTGAKVRLRFISSPLLGRKVGTIATCRMNRTMMRERTKRERIIIYMSQLSPSDALRRRRRPCTN